MPTFFGLITLCLVVVRHISNRPPGFRMLHVLHSMPGVAVLSASMLHCMMHSSGVKATSAVTYSRFIPCACFCSACRQAIDPCVKELFTLCQNDHLCVLCLELHDGRQLAFKMSAASRVKQELPMFVTEWWASQQLPGCSRWLSRLVARCVDDDGNITAVSLFAGDSLDSMLKDDWQHLQLEDASHYGQLMTAHLVAGLISMGDMVSEAVGYRISIQWLPGRMIGGMCWYLYEQSACHSLAAPMART